MESGKKKVSCLGPVGSFSEVAARKMCPECEIVLCHSFSEAVKKLTGGEVDHAVLPVENSLNSAVRETLDLLQQEEIFGTEEYLLPIDHRLATLKGVKAEDIRYIYSHEQAIGQCAQYLRAQFPSAQYVHTASTADSLMVRSSTVKFWSYSDSRLILAVPYSSFRSVLEYPVKLTIFCEVRLSSVSMHSITTLSCCKIWVGKVSSGMVI